MNAVQPEQVPTTCPVCDFLRGRGVEEHLVQVYHAGLVDSSALPACVRGELEDLDYLRT